MDRTIIVSGSVLVSLGLGFLVAGELDYSLHPAFGTGGSLWLVIGAITLGVGMKVSPKKKSEKSIRVGAI